MPALGTRRPRPHRVVGGRLAADEAVYCIPNVGFRCRYASSPPLLAAETRVGLHHGGDLAAADRRNAADDGMASIRYSTAFRAGCPAGPIVPAASSSTCADFCSLSDSSRGRKPRPSRQSARPAAVAGSRSRRCPAPRRPARSFPDRRALVDQLPNRPEKRRQVALRPVHLPQWTRFSLSRRFGGKRGRAGLPRRTRCRSPARCPKAHDPSIPVERRYASACHARRAGSVQPALLRGKGTAASTTKIGDHRSASPMRFTFRARCARSAARNGKPPRRNARSGPRRPHAGRAKAASARSYSHR